MKEVDIYTDGACSYNPGPGGYAAILIYNGIEKVVSGHIAETTNNRMELFAIISGLKALKTPCIVNLYSDSALCIDAFEKKWIDNWQKNNWKTSNKEDVKNKDLWNALIIETKTHKVNFIKVKGHADNEYNNRCDEIARGEIEKYKATLG